MAIETDEKTEETSESDRNVGRIEEIQGVVIEAVFPDELPEINSAIYIEREASEDDEKISGGISSRLICEVQQHLGDDRVRAVAMDTTDGLARGMEVVDTGGPITRIRLSPLASRVRTKSVCRTSIRLPRISRASAARLKTAITVAGMR